MRYCSGRDVSISAPVTIAAGKAVKVLQEYFRNEPEENLGEDSHQLLGEAAEALEALFLMSPSKLREKECETVGELRQLKWYIDARAFLMNPDMDSTTVIVDAVRGLRQLGNYEEVNQPDVVAALLVTMVVEDRVVAYYQPKCLNMFGSFEVRESAQAK